jgi:hypothetical protein
VHVPRTAKRRATVTAAPVAFAATQAVCRRSLRPGTRASHDAFSVDAAMEGGPSRHQEQGLGLATRLGSARLRVDCLGIHLALSKLSQQKVGLLLLLETPVQKFLLVAQTQLACKSCGGAIGRYFVMYNFLNR